MGADVVKIERPGGVADRTRDLPYDTHGHESLTWRFLNYNTSKSSVTLDLKTDEGQAVLREVLEESDVVVENMRPGSMERLGLGYERLHELNPGLVYCSIKGYGGEGPYSGMPALDTLVQGVGGLAWQVGKKDQPGTMDILIVDMLSGLYAAWAIAMALYERADSGQGQRIDISMLDATVSFLGHQLAEYAATPKNEDAQFGPDFAPNGYFRAADGYLGLLLLPDHWEGFCEAIDRGEWTNEDHPYGTNASRLEHRETLHEDLEAVLNERTAEEWITHFEGYEATIPVADVNDIDELVDHPQVRAQEAVLEREHPGLGEYLTPNVVPKFSRTPGAIEETPLLGDDTDQVLSALGLDSAERRQLREDGVLE
jgi:formyl-CoA transferase/CoA:oxalate CoA-transferase